MNFSSGCNTSKMMQSSRKLDNGHKKIEFDQNISWVHIDLCPIFQWSDTSLYLCEFIRGVIYQLL